MKFFLSGGCCCFGVLLVGFMDVLLKTGSLRTWREHFMCCVFQMCINNYLLHGWSVLTCYRHIRQGAGFRFIGLVYLDSTFPAVVGGVLLRNDHTAADMQTTNKPDVFFCFVWCSCRCCWFLQEVRDEHLASFTVKKKKHKTSTKMCWLTETNAVFWHMTSCFLWVQSVHADLKSRTSKSWLLHFFFFLQLTVL